jgi:hypothetical protein
MSQAANKPDWNCPLCITHRLPYGTSCKDVSNCGGELNVNAAHYLNANRTRKAVGKAKGTGISEIANKEME